MKNGKTMEIAIAIGLLITTIVAVMFWSVKVSKRLSIVVFSVIFFGIAVAIIIWQGFTQQAFENIGVVALILFIGWVRFSKSIAETARVRGEFVDRLSQKKRHKCKVCGQKLSYHRVPKKLSQLLLGGLTCENCGAEYNVPSNLFMPR